MFNYYFDLFESQSFFSEIGRKIIIAFEIYVKEEFGIRFTK